MKLPLEYNEEKGVDNRSNFEKLQTGMSSDWDDISIYTVNRTKKGGAQPTYSIVCACRKQKPMPDTPAMSNTDEFRDNALQLLLTQLANLHA